LIPVSLMEGDFWEHKLNSQQIAYFNAFVKNSLWPRVKFVSDSFLIRNQSVIRDINKAMGFTTKDAQAAYRKDLVKNLKSILTQKRAYMVKNLRKVVISEFFYLNSNACSFLRCFLLTLTLFFFF
jgi:hypothetical protein